MGLSLKRNFGFALAGNLGYAASQYIVLLVFIKLFTMEDVGQFIYASAFTTPLMMALEMQLRNFYITDHSGKLQFADYTFFRVITTLIGVIILSFIAYAFKPEYFYVILIVTFIKSFESQLDLLYGVYQKNNKLDYVAYSRIIRGIVAIIIVITLSFIFDNILISLLGYLISWILLYFFYERKQVVKRGFLDKSELIFTVPKLSKIKILLLLCAPMFASIFIDKYYLNYPRVVVEKYFGAEALAVFGSLLYFKTLASQCVTSLAQAFIPRMAKLVEQKSLKKVNALLMKMIALSIGFSSLMIIVAYFFGDTIIQLLYTPEYAQYNNVLLVILGGAAISFTYLYIGSTLTCIRKQWIRLPISIVSFILLFSLIHYKEVSNILEVAIIIVYVEAFSLVLYIASYYYFIKSLKSTIE